MWFPLNVKGTAVFFWEGYKGSAVVGTVQTLHLVLSLPVTSSLFCLRHFKGKFWVVEREVFASPAVLCDLCDWEGGGCPSFHPCRGWGILERLYNGGACFGKELAGCLELQSSQAAVTTILLSCSAPGREGFSASEWWGHPKTIQPSACVLGLGALLLHCAS